MGEEKVFTVGHVFEQANKELIEGKRPKVWG
jgi:hypothetical protein